MLLITIILRKLLTRLKIPGLHFRAIGQHPLGNVIILLYMMHLSEQSEEYVVVNKILFINKKTKYNKTCFGYVHNLPKNIHNRCI